MMSDMVKGVLSGKQEHLDSMQMGLFRLMTTEFKYQDPTAELGNTDFVLHLATISAASQLSTVNNRLGEISDAVKSEGGHDQGGKAMLFLDRDVLADNGGLIKFTSGVANVNFTLSGEAASLKLIVSDESGRVLLDRKIKGNFAPGINHLDLIGDDDEEMTLLPYGVYRLGIEAYDSKGRNVDVSDRVEGKVDSVIIPVDGEPLLRIGGAVVSADQVRLVQINSVEGDSREVADLFLADKKNSYQPKINVLS